MFYFKCSGATIALPLTSKTLSAPRISKCILNHQNTFTLCSKYESVAEKQEYNFSDCKLKLNDV